jgi:trimethylamine:corrinoid methyltransferase-like protein
MDMRTCALAIGTPKLSIIAAASTQLARYYGLAGRCGEALTDTNNPDLQAGFEPIFCLLTAANNGADFVLHTAGVLSSYLAYSHENFVIVDEMCGMVRRYYQGIAVDPDSPANDVINNGGAGGNLVEEEQTVTGCRHAFGQPALSDRNGLETWLANVQPDMIQRADQRWQDLLTEHEDPPVDATTKRQFQAYLAEREC